MSKNSICVVLPCNIYVAPFYFRYEKILSEMQVEFDLIIWNRDGIEEKSEGEIIYFNVLDTANNGDKMKIIKFYKFAYFVKQTIKKNKYDKILFLGSYAGNAVFLSNFLKNNYHNRYWFDIRDYTYEWFKPYYNSISSVIKNSYKTAISSSGYEEFLPKYDYIYTHNIDKINIKKCKKKKNKKTPQTPICISFIGNVRYYKENIKLLELFRNDDRFVLQYYGSGSEELQKYCKENNILNVDFHGKFAPEETSRFYNKTHIINNVYGNSGIELTTALSNKLYFSGGLHLPILVSPNTYIQKISEKYKFGYVIDYDKLNLADELYNWYIQLIKNDNFTGYDDFWKGVIKEDEKFEKTLEDFIKTDKKIL